MNHHPERSEGSLGTDVPREDMDGLSPRAEARGSLGATHLGTTSRSAVPNEVRDASLSLGRTKNGRSAGQSRRDFFEQPPFLG
jgi:hypothetical protein